MSTATVRTPNASYRRVLRSMIALQKLRRIEDDLREIALVESDTRLAKMADEMRAALSAFQ